MERSETESVVDEGELRLLLSEAGFTPEALRGQQRGMITVQDHATKETLRSASHGSERLRDAAAVLVLTGEPGGAGFAGRPRFLTDFNAGREDFIEDQACRSAALAVMNLVLSAPDFGYEAWPVVEFDATLVSSVLGLDMARPPLALIALVRERLSARAV